MGLVRHGRRGCAARNGSGGCLIVAVTLVLCALPRAVMGAPLDKATYQPLVAAVHVHTTMSTGSLTLDQVAERARDLGIDAVVLSENFALRYEYGLPPLRGIFRATMPIPSVTARDVGDFLEAVEETQARHAEVLVVPGVEVAPHYFWTGSLLSGNLTMHNSQRNILVLGLNQAEDYAALPASGNVASYRFGWETVFNFSPALLLIPALGSLRAWRRQNESGGGGGPTRGRRRIAWTLIAAVMGGLLLVNAWPFSRPAYSSYDDQLGYRPYQALIDEAVRKGGLAVWSLPEARDRTVHSFGPLGIVTVRTDPHPEALVQTTGYTGFGGVYQDTRRVAEPGGVWDQLLSDSLRGRRSSYPVLYGEIAFHTPGQAGIELDQVVNVLWVREWSRAGVLEAMRAGRLYAVGQYRRDARMRLDEFRVEVGHGSALSGETVHVAGNTKVTVKVAVSMIGAEPRSVALSLIRSGQVVARHEGKTPLQYSYVDEARDEREPVFFRVAVTGAGEIVSNPIFVIPKRSGEGSL